MANLSKEKEVLTARLKKRPSGALKKAQALRDRGYTYLMEDKIDKALECYEQAIQLDPHYASPHNDLGVIYEEKGLLGKAEEEYKKTITLDSNFVAGYANLALLYEKQNKFEKALSYWQKRASCGAPDDPWTKKAIEKLKAYGKEKD
ncbi:MAG: tetratricopeptide repeat protein [Candidatus Omnitrophota bacterium]